MDAGAQAGVLQKQEHHFIENVFELEERNVPSSMTTRENVIYFTLNESEESIRQKLAQYPYSKFLVCSENIDDVIATITQLFDKIAVVQDNVGIKHIYFV